MLEENIKCRPGHKVIKAVFDTTYPGGKRQSHGTVWICKNCMKVISKKVKLHKGGG